MQLFLILLIVCGISYLGVGIADFYKKRCKLMSDIVMFCDCLISDIDFLHTPIKKIIDNRTKQFGAEMNKVLIQYASVLERGELIEYSQPVTSIYFSKSECDMFMSLLIELGKSDCDSQVSTIKNFKTAFQKFYEEASEEKKKYAPMITKLSVLSGILMGILLI